ncbi:hypothetical protein [Senegalia massiliensis]|uniref:Uncharacterized protein n=1 Tax=Senegalia massiliensis TaxID=1720316 RepID=A0A845QZ66_9CLOT|nr:hypothetical protein [Senegalia massiliensis]NBI07601.1 hypothetical protein [Senegalia massiliensis]
MKKIGFILVLSLVLTISLGLVETNNVHADSIKNTMNDIKSSGSVIDKSGDAKGQIMGIVKDVFDIAMIVVTGIVLVSGIMTGAQLSGAGDNPQRKAQLKNKLYWHIGGLIFLANYLAFFSFISDNVNIF